MNLTKRILLGCTWCLLAIAAGRMTGMRAAADPPTGTITPQYYCNTWTCQNQFNGWGWQGRGQNGEPVACSLAVSPDTVRICLSTSTLSCFTDYPPYPQTCHGTYGLPGGASGVCTVDWTQCSGTVAGGG